jgi:hypothetical protein
MYFEDIWLCETLKSSSLLIMSDKKVFSEIVRVLFGSWYSILGHAIVFALILMIWRSMVLFTTIVSIEAIFISIFILMLEYRQEEYRERHEQLLRMQDRKLVKEDVDLTQHVVSEIAEIKKHQKQIIDSFEEIKKSLKL